MVSGCVFICRRDGKLYLTRLPLIDDFIEHRLDYVVEGDDIKRLFNYNRDRIYIWDNEAQMREFCRFLTKPGYLENSINLPGRLLKGDGPYWMIEIVDGVMVCWNQDTDTKEAVTL